jgi:serine/threonine protein kinase
MTHSQGPSESTVLADRYELGQQLAAGGMADVYRATDLVLRRPVAVKVLRDTANREDDRARFLAEARTLARLSHPGLVTLLDAGVGQELDSTGARSAAGTSSAVVSTNRPFLVMELVEGQTLAQALAGGPLDPAAAAALGAQVAEALAYVHSHGVIHRDVKPGNVLLNAAGGAKLADFGIARLLGDDAGHTRTGQTIGTAAYLAPEQVTGQPVSRATDVYSLGLVLLEALTGTREYTGPAMEAALARLNQPPQIPDALPASWRELLERMTATEPDARPDATEVAERLSGRPGAARPIISRSGPASETLVMPTAPDRTSVLTAPLPQASTARARSLGGWLRGLSPRVVALAGLAVLAAVATVVGLLVTGNPGSPSEIPANTPTELRQPLEDLHRAVYGGGE